MRLRALLYTLVLSLLCLPVTATAAEKDKAAAGTPQSTPYVDNRNGTVTDKSTGLMWKKCSEGQTWDKKGNTCTGTAAGQSWDDALNAIEILNGKGGFAGYKDWRLPTIKELATLVEYDRPNPIDPEMFPATPAAWFWSSTPFIRSPQRAWFVAFGYGDISSERIDNQGMHIRLVRGGKK